MTPATYTIERDEDGGLYVTLEFDDPRKVSQRGQWRVSAEAAFYHRDNPMFVPKHSQSYGRWADLMAALSVACDELADVYGYVPPEHVLPF